MVYMGARLYDPQIGRFLSVDPVHFIESSPASFNRYAYANNSPYGYVDPNGELPILLVIPLVVKAIDYGVTAYDTYQAYQEGGVAGAAEEVAISSAQSIIPGLKTGKRLFEAADNVASAAKGVGKYEVGAYDTLKSKSLAGDGLDIHHAMQKNPAGQVVGGYNPATGPSIAVPRGEHSRIPTLKGEYGGSARDLLAKDIRDLRNNTNAPTSSLRDLIDLNKQTYPGAFGK